MNPIFLAAITVTKPGAVGIGIVALVVLYLAFKVTKFVVKMLLLLAVLAALWPGCVVVLCCTPWLILKQGLPTSSTVKPTSALTPINSDESRAGTNIGAKPKGEVVADILAAIRERRP